ncbi:MAG: hypothetical protein JXX29_21210 [Deltaproteobacteria bacterium]|nr:hypothetical protein [Deltaproteobacteria bacterium]MBN2674215.1 hypothetical protein [Deltaproteobacteria bacterium]
MKHGLVVALLVSAATFATGCFEEEDSCNIHTPGIYVEYEVTERNGNAYAEVVFWTGDEPGGTYLELGACGDAVSVNGTKLSESGSNPTVYRATIDIAETYNIVFDRPNEGSYSSVITTMPEPVDILTPSGDSLARDEAFDITWESNSTGQINLLVSSDCFWDYPSSLGDQVTDNGTHTVNAQIFDVKESEAGSTCTATIELTRETDGILSEKLKGTIVGKTMDSTTFTSSPAVDETAQ